MKLKEPKIMNVDKRHKKKKSIEEIEEICYQYSTYKGYDYILFYTEFGIMARNTAYVKIPDNHPEVTKLAKRKWFAFGGMVKTLKKLSKKTKTPVDDTKYSKSFLKKRHYRWDYDAIDLDIHGGLTFAERVKKKDLKSWMQPFTEGWWVGWDYMHAGDEMYLPKERAIEKSEVVQDLYADIMAIHSEYPTHEKRWTWEEIEMDCKNAIDQLILLEKWYYRLWRKVSKKYYDITWNLRWRWRKLWK